MNVIPSIYRYNRLGLISGGFSPSELDPDARAYIAAVEAADAQALEPSVKAAYDSFIRGCKADGIWDAIKASCILAGARTLDGALVPLVGTAPTNFNFVSGDYNRETGLKGDGTTKYLATGRNLAASDSQNNHHASVFPTDLPSEDVNSAIDFGPLLAARASGTVAGSVQIVNNVTFDFAPNIIQLVSTASSPIRGVGRTANALAGLSRSESGSFTGRGNNASQTFNDASVSLANADWFVFARTLGGAGEKYTKSRLAFYSIGEALDLAALDSRISTLINRLHFSITTGEDWRSYDPDAVAYIVKLFNSGVTYA